MQTGLDITSIAIIGSILGALISLVSTLVTLVSKRQDAKKSVKLSITTPSGKKKEIIINRSNPSDLADAHRILNEVVNEPTETSPEVRPQAGLN